MTVDQEKLIEVATGTPDDAMRQELFWDNLFSAYSQYVEEVSPWWSPQRDAELRLFWKDGLYGSALMTLAQSKLASMPMKVEAIDKSIASHVRQASELTKLLHINSGFGNGWYQTMLLFTEDYLGQDNGGFLEILGDGEPDGPIEGPVLGVRHLDSSRCQRTGNPVYPVIYHGQDGKKYKMHFGRIFTMAQMPSANAKMRGVGMCSVSRSLRLIENLANTVNYKDEKMGARPIRQLLVGSGITGKEIIKALAASELMMDNLNMRDSARTVAIGSTAGEISVDKVELSGMEGFNESATFTFASYALALAWGLEFNEVIPQSAGKQSDIISLQRSRGMLPQQFITAFEEQASIKLVPAHLRLTLDFKDDQADKEHALIEDITSRSYQRQIEAGVTNPDIVQQSMHERGHISDEQLASMRLVRHMLPSGVPVATAFTDPDYAELISVSPNLLMVYDSDVAQAEREIYANTLLVYEWMGTSPSARDSMRGRVVLSALDWLSEQYNKAKMQQVAEERAIAEDVGQQEQNDNTQNVEEEKSLAHGYGPATKFFIENNRVVWDTKAWG